MFKGLWSEYVVKYHEQIYSILEQYKNESIVELGCGLGHNLIQFLHRGFHDISGYDVSDNAIKLVRKYCLKKGYQIKFDIVDLTKSLPEQIIKDKIVFTHACLEQLKNFMPRVLQNIIDGKPKLVINFEIDYDSSPFLVKQYFDARDYQNNLVRELKRLEKKGYCISTQFQNSRYVFHHITDHLQ